MTIALDYLSPIQRAQLRHTRPDIFGYPACQRCGCGQVIAGQCLQCGAEHDRQGNYLFIIQKGKKVDQMMVDKGFKQLGAG